MSSREATPANGGAAQPQATVSGLPAVTVVIPAYNRAATLGATLASVAAQTWQDLEVIVVDDASQDTTVQVALSGTHGVPVRVIVMPRNGGACRARNAGLAEARGRYVTFLDSDDTWHPDFLSTLVGMLETAGPDTGCAACSYAAHDPNGRVTRVVRQRVQGDIAAAMLRGNPVGATSCAVMRSDVARSIGGFDPDFVACQDYDIFIRLSQVTRFVTTTEILFNYSDDPGRDRITGNQRRRLQGLLTIHRKHLRHGLQDDPRARDAFKGRVADILMRIGRARLARPLMLSASNAQPVSPRAHLRCLLAYIGASPARYTRTLKWFDAGYATLVKLAARIPGRGRL